VSSRIVGKHQGIRRRAIRLGVIVPENVWSAARLQGKSEGWIDRSAQMYSAYRWRAVSPGHDELRCVLFLINGTVIADHFRKQVSSAVGNCSVVLAVQCRPWWEL
jgi:hypothetical protein